jgi:hypothetical protein
MERFEMAQEKRYTHAPASGNFLFASLSKSASRFSILELRSIVSTKRHAPCSIVAIDMVMMQSETTHDK